MFTILCCADLYGEKVNLEITLDGRPRRMEELEEHLLHLFRGESDHFFADRVPRVAFQIACLQIYDDVMLRWVDFTSLDQLHEFDQLYAFQPQSHWHRDSQQDLPPPRPPVRSRAASAVAQRLLQAPPVATAGGVPGGVSAAPPPSARASSFASTPYTGGPSARLGPIDHSAAGLYGGSPQPRPAAGVARTHTASHVSGTPEPRLVYNASSATAASRSPTHARLQETKREEHELEERLSRLRYERDELERAAAVEAEQERRRQAEEANGLIRQKEEEIWRQREALVRAEQEFQRLVAQKRNLLSSPHTNSLHAA